MKNFLRTPFASALAGGLIVALLGWVAIAAGWVDGDDDPDSAEPPTPVTLAAPAAERDEGDGLTINEIYSQASPGVANIEAQVSTSQAELGPFGAPRGGGGTATGSGFVIDDEGRIITNAHVVDGAEEISVKLTEDGDTYDAELLGEDPSTDIAVLDIEAPADELESVELGDSSDVTVGDPVVAIGNPFGLDHTATAGIVSGIQREIRSPNGFTIRDAIQTDAPINPGNSGGPLLDAAGRVIGVNSQIATTSGSGGSVGIGFAVPSNTVRQVVPRLRTGSSIKRAYVGIETGPSTVGQGALVSNVVPGGPAEQGGIQIGDTITRVGGQEIRAPEDISSVITSRRPGDEVDVELRRAGRDETVRVTLGTRPESASTPSAPGP